jgi:hypothetical protein
MTSQQATPEQGSASPARPRYGTHEHARMLRDDLERMFNTIDYLWDRLELMRSDLEEYLVENAVSEED